MRKQGLLLIGFWVLTAVNNVFASGNITLISGLVNRENAKAVILFEVIEGKKVEYASTKLDQYNAFALALPSLKEGFYYLSDQYKGKFFRIYLKDADRLLLNLNDDGYELVNGSPENQVLYNWYKQSAGVYGLSFNKIGDTTTYLSFFPNLEKLLPKMPSIKKNINTKNKHFNELMNMAVDQDIEHAAINFILTPRVAHPSKEQFPAYYNCIVKPGKYPSAALLKFGDGAEHLARYVTFSGFMRGVKDKSQNTLQAKAELFGNDTLKGAFVANSFRYKTYEELEEAVAPVKKYLITDSMQASYFRAVKSLAGFKKGSPSYNFSMEDIGGKKVSMNDLKGKVVLVDVWATWCGPCKKEIPHLKKLEEEMRGKNVEFISISVDEIKDKEKWKKMVEKEQLSGTQLFSGGWTEITKYYDITGIPRFMVFDQEGKIVSVDSPRPSQPELKDLLQNTLDRK